MNPTSLLEQLRDVHTPEPIGWWPLAPGWWILLGLIVVLSATLIYLTLKYWRGNLWRRQAQHEFRTLQQNYFDEPSREQLIALNQLLKRILCSASGSRKYLQLTGDAWVDALQQVRQKDTPILQPEELRILSQGIYQANPETLDAAAFQRLAQWINKVK